MCGVIYLQSLRDQLIDNNTILNLERLIEHRGQDNTGICYEENNELLINKKRKLREQELPEITTKKLGLGVRYATIGGNTEDNYTPTVFKGKNNITNLETTLDNESIALFLNGEARTEWVKEFLEEQGYNIKATNDTALLAGLIQHLTSQGLSTIDSLKKILSEVPGAYSIILMKPGQTIISRGKNGIKPLELLITDDYLCASSETQIFGLINNHYYSSENWRQVKPGELIIINNQEIKSEFIKPEQEAKCIFELIYFSHAAGYAYGIPVMKFRGRAGKNLTPINNTENEIIVAPVPNSGRNAADGYANENRYKHREALIQGIRERTFITPGQDNRNSMASMKYIPAPYVYDNVEMVFIDDSLVRGTTAPFIISNALLSGALKVHLKFTAPPLKHPCYYGIDMKKPYDFIAYNKNENEVLTELISRANNLARQEIATTNNVTLEYLTIEKLLKTANSFYAEELMTELYPYLSEHAIKEISLGIQNQLTTDNLLRNKGMNEARERVINYLHQEMDHLNRMPVTRYPNINDESFNQIFNEYTRKQWCTACFTGEYTTCINECTNCTKCKNNIINT